MKRGKEKQKQKKSCVFLKNGEFWSKFNITNVFIVKFPF